MVRKIVFGVIRVNRGNVRDVKPVPASHEIYRKIHMLEQA